MRIQGFLIGILLLSCFSGCYEVRDGIDECAMKVRNKRRARAAWRRSKSVYDCIEYRDDFEDGFRDGYYDIASGGRGTPPTLPPRKYWNSRYQNQEGHMKMMAWFDGFDHGALAALEDGVAEWNRIVTNHASRNNWQPDGWVEQEVMGLEMDPAMAPPTDPSDNGVSVVPPPAPAAPPLAAPTK